MLRLIEIKKDYISKNQPPVHALKGISLCFRRNEFVSILGQSGCGKTTLLNVVGGLDSATDGDLVIEGKSTHDYKDRDWDTYRNHSVGFVFQSYNLIPHINVLANVELALTISGISKKDRKDRALQALKTVGLEGYEKKKPNQLSGGQMQRVSIARAIVNNPEILLADEPTGALDSETSIQVMDILKDISKDRLVIMVTHNPDLAEQYSTRIVRMSDGLIVSDSNPYEGESIEEREIAINKKAELLANRKDKSSMSFKTSFGLSLRNLLTKKGRTFLTAFAGSIGIIGIALVLSVSFGFDQYIARVQEDALSSYPMTITKSSVNIASLLTGVSGTVSENTRTKFPTDGKVSNNDTYARIFSQYVDSSVVNDIKGFKAYLEGNDEYGRPIISNYLDAITGIKYSYNLDFNIYTTGDKPTQVYPYNFFNGEYDYVTQLMNSSSAIERKDGDTFSYAFYEVVDELNDIVPSLFKPFSEMIPNLKSDLSDKEYNRIIDDQYDVVEGRMPSSKDEVVVIVDQYNTIDNFMLYALGEMTPQDLIEDLIVAMMPDFKGYIEATGRERQEYKKTLKDLLNIQLAVPMSYTLFNNENDGSNQKWKIKSGTELKSAVDNAMKLKVVGVVRQKQSVTSTSMSGVIGYLPSLTSYVINESSKDNIPGYETSDTNVVKAYNEHDRTVWLSYTYPFTKVAMNSQGEVTGRYSGYSTSGQSGNAKKLGIVDTTDPDAIYFYAKDFDSKAKINELVNNYNQIVKKDVTDQFNKDVAEGKLIFESEEEAKAYLNTMIKKRQITVNDSVAILMSSVQTIVNSVSYVLIAFVSISLVVSSIMIGIITYVSVLERTKEIGVLRSIGARKIDIANVFNAETLIIGASAGLIGDAIALILDIPIRYIIVSLTQVSINIIVPWYGLVVLPIISILLTVISGLIPAKYASRKDPVIALRSE